MARSFKERDGSFVAIDCSGWSEFKNVASEFLKELVPSGPTFEHFLFRGQSCSSWSLESSFDRRNRDLSFRDRDKKYDKIISSFVRSYETYGDMDGQTIRIPFRDADNKNMVYYEAVAQHFGLPTRLLDWTKSLYVAAFFSLSKIEESETGLVSVWALDMRRAREAFSEAHLLFLNDLYKENRRQLWQMGVFVRNLTHRQDLTELFRSGSQFYPKKMDDEFPMLIRFDFPTTVAAEAIDDLNMMRINSITLFPGIEGVVRWLDRGGYALDET